MAGYENTTRACNSLRVSDVLPRRNASFMAGIPVKATLQKGGYYMEF
jgi:hypothetical protein